MGVLEILGAFCFSEAELVEATTSMGWPCGAASTSDEVEASSGLSSVGTTTRGGGDF